METLDEIRASNKEFLTPSDVAPVIGCHPYSINVAAQEQTLPFRHVLLGRRVRIPRLAFIAWMEGKPDTTPGQEN